MHLPTTYAQQLLSGAVKADASLTYPAVIPGTNSVDCACQSENRKRITPADLDLYNNTVTQCIESSSLTTSQMQELESLWATCISMEQQGTLSNTWYILAIVFIILFGLLGIGVVLYCIISNYTKEQVANQQRRKRAKQMASR